MARVQVDENYWKVQSEVDAHVDALTQIDGDDEKYDKELTRIERLEKLKDKFDNRKRLSTSDVLQMAQLGVQTLQVGLILGHERTHAITTKAVQFMTKLVSRKI